MARRRQDTSNDTLTKAQLAAMRKELESQERYKVEIAYKACHNAAAYRSRLPSPALIQELVTIWKVLRKVESPAEGSGEGVTNLGALRDPLFVKLNTL